MFGLIVLLTFTVTVESVGIGTIIDQRMTGNALHSFSNISSEQCICEMIEANLFAVNYYLTNNTCEVFDYNGSSVQVQFNANGLFTFVNQSSMMITSIQSAGKYTGKTEKIGKRTINRMCEARIDQLLIVSRAFLNESASMQLFWIDRNQCTD